MAYRCVIAAKREIDKLEVTSDFHFPILFS